jgi:hypothetical protein
MVSNLFGFLFSFDLLDPALIHLDVDVARELSHPHPPDHGSHYRQKHLLGNKVNDLPDDPYLGPFDDARAFDVDLVRLFSGQSSVNWSWRQV